MGCISEREKDETVIDQKILLLQIILCSVSDIKSGFFFLEEGEFITKSSIKMGFSNMHNSLSATLTKSASIMEILDQFILPFKAEGQEDKYNFQDVLIALFVNSKSNAAEKASAITQLLYRDKEELNQTESVLLFQRVFKVVFKYSFSIADKYVEKEKPKEEQKADQQKPAPAPADHNALLETAEKRAKIVGESLVEKDKTIKIAEFAEKCKTYLPDRFYRDILVPSGLRLLVRRDYANQDQVDREVDEKNKKEKEEKEKKEKEEKEKKDKEEKEKKEKEEKEKKEKEEKDKKEKEEQEKKEKEEKDKKDKEEKDKKEEPKAN